MLAEALVHHLALVCVDGARQGGIFPQRLFECVVQLFPAELLALEVLVHHVLVLGGDGLEQFDLEVGDAVDGEPVRAFGVVLADEQPVDPESEDHQHQRQQELVE